MLWSLPSARRRCALAAAAAVLLSSSALIAQIVFPKGRTRPEIERQLQSLDAQDRQLQELRTANARAYFADLDTALTKGADATVGTFTIRSDEVAEIARLIEEGQAAEREGRRTTAVRKAKEAEEKIAAAVKRTGGTLTGQINPKDLAKRIWESREPAREAAKSLAKVSQGLENDKNLQRIQRRVRDDIATLESELPSAPYERPQPPAPTNRVEKDFAGLDEAIKLLDWIDKGNRAFRTKEEEDTFYSRNPDLAAYRAEAETQAIGSRDAQSQSAPADVSPLLPPTFATNELCQAEFWRRNAVLMTCHKAGMACLDKCSGQFNSVSDRISCNNSCPSCQAESSAMDEMRGRCSW